MEKKLHEIKMDEPVSIFLLIKDVAERKTRANQPFLMITFQDTSGVMSGIVWNATSADIEQYQPGAVVFLEGAKEEYNGKPQLKISNIRLAEEGEPSKPELYVKRAPVNREKMIEALNEVIFDITNPTMNRIVRYLLNKYNQEFFTAPAAKTNHHAFNGGLAYHTISMLELAKTIVDYYPNINASLLYSGLILHDLGKVIELSGPTATEYTLEGQLIGHIVIVDEEITAACAELDISTHSEDALLLRHMVLAHHGLLEYGSPVRPQIKEAEILHYLDQIDAKINMIEDGLTKVDDGQFTERIWALENRSFYKPTIHSTKKEEDI